MEEKMNIKQIAELAGVSVATVSRVINQNGRFSAETEQRVRDVIQKYHYIPNTVAKGLRTSRMQVVGIVVPDIVNNHFARLVRELEQIFFERGYSTVICNTNESWELEQRHVQTLVSQQVTGILFISGRHHYEMDGIPMIYVDRRPDDFTESDKTIVIESDNEQGGYLAAAGMIGSGCKKIAVLTAYGIDYNHTARLAGCQRALKEHGAGAGRVIDVAEISYEAARTAVMQAIDDGTEFDALLCTADELAIGAILGLKERNRRVPGDVRVTGFDDTTMAAVYNPPVSSVHQSVDQMAECAVDAMLELVESGSVREPHRKLPVYLVERES